MTAAKKYTCGCKEQDDSAQECVPKRNLSALARVEVTQAPKVLRRPNSRWPSEDHDNSTSTRITVPLGSIPSFTKWPPEDHDNTARNGKVEPAGNPSAARHVAKLGINGNVQANGPDTLMEHSKRLVQLILEVPRTPLARDKMKNMAHGDIQVLVHSHRRPLGMTLSRSDRNKRGQDTWLPTA